MGRPLRLRRGARRAGWSGTPKIFGMLTTPSGLLVTLSSLRCRNLRDRLGVYMRRFFLSVVASLLLASGLALPQTTTNLILLHTNDMHGQVLPRDGSGGMAELATVIRRERPDLILDGGDMFTGTMMSDEFV